MFCSNDPKKATGANQLDPRLLLLTARFSVHVHVIHRKYPRPCLAEKGITVVAAGPGWTTEKFNFLASFLLAVYRMSDAASCLCF